MKSFYDFTKDENILHKGKHFFIIRDNFPVSPGHMLIVSNKLKGDYFQLVGEEIADLDSMILKAKELIEKDYSPDGYNIGMNCGEAAGQTIQHFHCHLIPRYVGDMENPKGGIRHCVADKGYY